MKEMIVMFFDIEKAYNLMWGEMVNGRMYNW